MSGRPIGRRRVLVTGAALAAVLASGAPASRRVLAETVRGLGPFGELGPPDEFGVRVPADFTSRLIARTGDRVGTTSHRWHDQPDGGGVFDLPDGGHVYVSNSEIGRGGGGVGAIRFDRRGEIVDARSILSGTSKNCNGGSTPWGTWLSCEEVDPDGQVWECDPTGDPSTAIHRPALGAFRHEAAHVVEAHQSIFLTEDAADGRLYRFRPTVWPDLAAGRLDAAFVDGSGRVTWKEVSPSEPERSSDTTPFRGAEGLASWNDTLFMSTKRDRRLWRYDIEQAQIDVLHDCIADPTTALSSVDHLVVDQATGNLFVAEDQLTRPELCIVTPEADGTSVIAPVVEFFGHVDSEVTGAALTTDGSTMYVSSQRGVDGRGLTFAITGPWRRTTAPITPPMSVGLPTSALRSAKRIAHP